jgi:hypothetical protein
MVSAIFVIVFAVFPLPLRHDRQRSPPAFHQRALISVLCVCTCVSVLVCVCVCVCVCVRVCE